MPRLRAAVLLLLLAGPSACARTPVPEPPGLPAGPALVTEAAERTRALKTAEFEITSAGRVDRIGIRGARGVVTREGTARGTVQVDQAGSIVELSFVATGDTLYVRGPTGGWQRVPLASASSVYDPSPILDPDRGVARLLATAGDPQVEAREPVDGADAFRLQATLDRDAVAALVPGITQDVGATLWVDAERRVLRQARFPVPGEGGGGTVTVTLRALDAPVSVTTP
ncbi:MAG TPA: LppX_LprAFG lipoprotein [Pilimelia sp.]|nr:LppX_LprAFG lipoprotein [Pilimelia sp.]